MLFNNSIVTAPAAAAAAVSCGCCMQLRCCNPTDLVCLIWSLQKLQLQPPSGWLLQYYSASQEQLVAFTDVQLASLAVALDNLLQQQQQQQQRQGEAKPQAVESTQQQLEPWQQLYAAAAVPPAVWQLQLEVELKSRNKNSRSRDSRGYAHSASGRGGLDELLQRQQQQQQQPDGVAAKKVDAEKSDEAAEQQPYEPLWVVGGVLRRWRFASDTDSWGAYGGAAASDDAKVALLSVM
jgi:hypothetical protein